MRALVKAVMFHESDEPIARTIEDLIETTGREGYVASIAQKREISVAGKYAGSISDLTITDRSNRSVKWSGKLISVARGWKKRDVFAALRQMPGISAMNIRRDITLYLALVSLHVLWVRGIYPDGVLPNLTETFVPPLTDDLWLNDFPHVFLVNDQVSGMPLPRLFGVQIGNQLLASLVGSKVWAKPRGAAAEEAQEISSP